MDDHLLVEIVLSTGLFSLNLLFQFSNRFLTILGSDPSAASERLLDIEFHLVVIEINLPIEASPLILYVDTPVFQYQDHLPPLGIRG